MTSPASRYLLDVNVLLARLTQDHIHHKLATEWLNTSDLRWANCAFTEAGFLRIATAPAFGRIALREATLILAELARHPGYRYLPITADWQTLTKPFASRLYGTRQVTDAYLLGIAVQEGYVLATFDKAMLHLAGREYRSHVRLLLPA